MIPFGEQSLRTAIHTRETPHTRKANPSPSAQRFFRKRIRNERPNSTRRLLASFVVSLYPAIGQGGGVLIFRPKRDRLLLEAISRGEFMIKGLRSKDLQRLLYTTSAN